MRLTKTPLSEQAYDELKRQILDQRLKPGERLNIDALSRSCGISSSPLREALTRLGAEGLVVFAANAGFSVAPVPGPAEIRQMMAFRLLMEVHCARTGCGNAAAVAAMRQSIERMRAMREAGMRYEQYRDYIALEQSFHEALVDSAANPFVSAAWRGLHLIISVARLSVAPQSGTLGSAEALAEHAAITDAFEKGDPDRVEKAVRRHLEAAINRVQAVDHPTATS
jgi:DNA-binding GntR family transcriptional regulator